MHTQYYIQLIGDIPQSSKFLDIIWSYPKKNMNTILKILKKLGNSSPLRVHLFDKMYKCW